MNDAQGSLVHGRTRWRRFAAVMVPATAVVGAIVVGMANGAIAASFAVSGQTFKVSASRLEGDGFIQYGGVVREANGTTHPVAVSGIKSAELFDLCQSVKVPNLPVVLTIRAGGNNTPAEATDLMIDMDSLQGDATFTNIQIGRDATTLDAAPGLPLPPANSPAGTFGQQAQHVTILNLKQVARSTSAGTFKLTGLDLGIKVGPEAVECFS